MLKGGVIGFGGMGQTLTKYINDKSSRAQIVAACDLSTDKLRQASDEFGFRATPDVVELCSWDLDFVLVVSSNCAHKEHVLAAANHGLHVFCEKPIALTLSDALAMTEAVERAGVTNVVNYSLRYTVLADTLKRFLAEDALGEILSVSSERSRAFGLYAGGARHRAVEAPEESGGWIIHHCCHQLDFIHYLFGDFETVYGATRTTVPYKDSEEVIFGTGRLKNGTLYHVGDNVARVHYGHLAVTGTKASFLSQTVGDYTFTRLRKENGGGDDVMSFEDGWILKKDRPHRAIEHFFDCIEKKAEPMATLRSSLGSLQAAIAMKKSAHTGQIIRLNDSRNASGSMQDEIHN